MRDELMKKFAEDDRLEQMAEHKRRMKANVDHVGAVVVQDSPDVGAHVVVPGGTDQSHETTTEHRRSQYEAL